MSEAHRVYFFRNVSSACLNDSDEQLVIFRNSDGKVLKSLGPRTAKLPYRID